MAGKKRAQATIFIIAGIVILVLVVLLFAGRRAGLGFLQVGQEDLKAEMDNMEDKVMDCLAASAKTPVETIGLQGGYLKVPPNSYRLWADNKVSYLCWNQVGKPTCINRLLTIDNMQSELQDAINEQLKKCLNVQEFAGPFAGYTIDAANTYEVNVKIKPSAVLVNLNYLITLKGKEGATESKKEFNQVLDYPLGKLYDVSQDIVTFETQFGEFEQLVYMPQKKGQYTIRKDRPYPDKIYILKERDNPYIFQFAVEDEEL